MGEGIKSFLETVKGKFRKKGMDELLIVVTQLHSEVVMEISGVYEKNLCLQILHTRFT